MPRQSDEMDVELVNISPEDTSSPQQPPTSRKLLKHSVAKKHIKGGDFALIDWVYDIEAHFEYQRSRNFEKRSESCIKNWISQIWMACHGWVAVLIIAVFTGLLAGMIHTCVDFLRDLKLGVCSDYFWLSVRNCCPGETKETCTAWKSWGDYFAGEGIRASTSTATLDFFAYALVSIGYAGLSAWLVKTFAPYAAGSGIPEIKTILSGVHIKRYLGGWTLLIKCIGVTLSVAAGLSLGMEGPFVHVASCVGNITSQFFKGFRFHESKRRELISAAVAAGVSVAFGAPIGGVLFSLEEASYYFPHKTMWRSFFCAVVAAIVLKRINPSGTGRLVLFQVDYNHQWHWFELLPFAIIGILGGIIGAAFNAANIRWCRLRKRTSLRKWPVVEVLCVVAFTAVINYLTPFLRTGASEFISRLFQECRPDLTKEEELESPTEILCYDLSQTTTASLVVLRLLLAASLKFLLTVFTFGIKVPAGLFIPSLFIGSCIGRIVGIAVESLYNMNKSSYIFSECLSLQTSCVVPGVYSIVGASAVLGGVTRMTISLVVIVFELTGGLEYLVPVMLAVLISKWVGELVGNRDSIYEMHIELNEYPFLDPKQEVNFHAVAADFMVSSQIQVLTVDGWTVRDLNTLLDGCDHNGFPVVMSHSDMRIVGFISRNNLIRALEQAGRLQHTTGPVDQDTEVLFYERTEEDRSCGTTCLDISWYLDPTPICVTPDTTVNRLLHIFKSLGIRTCLVAKNNKLVGIATRRGMIDMLKKAGENGEGLLRRRSVPRDTDRADL
eukprot:TRINITY_DN18805_c0_g1_i1.p1 TRINITY_DN18805_c0_g1~~TRINITY_DN18805_c0_g1_i1.p1  ORF type:complete len:803 (+),score=141.16 TRINITY_DN18805_c0_g1_i1:68-2410(+)